MIQQYAEITANRPLADGIFELTLTASEIAKFNPRPGQFVQVTVPDESKLLGRPISIFGMDGDSLRLAIQIAGAGTRLLSNCRVGDKLRLVGPIGNGFSIDCSRRYALVGGGVGVAPVAFASNLLANSAHISLSFVGFRSAKFAFGLDEFASPVICTEDGSLGERGFVTMPLESALKSGDIDEILACGPKPMLRAVQTLALRYNAPCQLSLETRMGCGVGGCLTCNCKISTDGGFTYKRACVDGPVFSATEVMFDE